MLQNGQKTAEIHDAEGSDLFGQWPVKVGWDAGFGPFFFVERWFERAVEIGADQRVKAFLGVFLVAAAEEMKPL